MLDSPQIDGIQGVQSAQYGSVDQGGDIQPVNFITYLMYQPMTGGDWVAESKVSWSLALGVTQNIVATSGYITTFSEGPSAVSSSAIGQWPAWDGRVSKVVAQLKPTS
jgi:hypothetical protein